MVGDTPFGILFGTKFKNGRICLACAMQAKLILVVESVFFILTEISGCSWGRLSDKISYFSEITEISSLDVRLREFLTRLAVFLRQNLLLILLIF